MEQTAIACSIVIQLQLLAIATLVWAMGVHQLLSSGTSAISSHWRYDLKLAISIFVVQNALLPHLTYGLSRAPWS